jgi:hypothetical protein
LFHSISKAFNGFSCVIELLFPGFQFFSPGFLSLLNSSFISCLYYLPYFIQLFIWIFFEFI